MYRFKFQNCWKTYGTEREAIEARQQYADLYGTKRVSDVEKASPVVDRSEWLNTHQETNELGLEPRG